MPSREKKPVVSPLRETLREREREKKSEVYESAEMYVTGQMLAIFSIPTLQTSPHSLESGMRERTIVAPHKSIAVATPHLAVHKLTRALERDVHVAVDGLELACATCQYLLCAVDLSEG